MKIPPERAAAVDAALDRLLDLPEEDRQSRIAEICGDDASLQELVERLLGFSEIPDDQFAGRVGLRTAMPSNVDAQPGYDLGQTIGSYRLLDEIGRGGMGVVYLAERVDGGFEQKVALKLSLRIADKESEARFTQERQILAELRHPNIAALLDGGITDGGQPYFALEFVEGQPIDTYCDGRKLSIDARLALFEQVVEGVRSAHSNLVVHRDLKPSNILVTRDGQAKLIDFGIAKLLGESERVGPDLTRTALRVMTPEYASPEQVTGQPISLASDIYQLGLLLYRLLSGRAPYRLEDTSPLTVERVVCQTLPTRPSTAVIDLVKDPQRNRRANELAAIRRTTPERLARSLRGDLDTIVLKALSKEPDRRYVSASDLLEDVRRYRTGLPVRARPDTWRYRMGKFVGRHRLGVAAATAFLALLIGYGATVTLQARRIGLERDRAGVEARRAEEVTEFLLGLFERSSPTVARDRELTVRELVDQGERRLLSGLEDQPRVRLRLLNTLARIYGWLGEYDRSLELTTRAGEIARQTVGDFRAELAESLAVRGDTLGTLNRSAEARPFLEEGLALADDFYGEDHVEAIRFRRLLATGALHEGRLGDAEKGFNEVLARLDRLPGNVAAGRADALAGLGVLHQTRGDFEPAKQAYGEALRLYSASYGDDHPLVLEYSKNLARVHGFLGDEAAALERQRATVEIAERIFGPQHPNVADQLTSLGLMHAESDRPVDAVAPLERALANRTMAFPGDNPKVTMAYVNLGYAWYMAGNFAEAEPQLSRAVETGRRDSGAVAVAQLYLGKVLRRTGRASAAAASFQHAWSIYEPIFGPDNGQVSEMAVDLADALVAAGRRAEALDFLQKQIARIADDSVPRQLMAEALELHG